MRKLIMSLSALCIAMTANAQINLIPNGDFSAGGDQWTEVSGPGVLFAYEPSGGNTGGYATIDASNGEWGILVSPVAPGAAGGGVPIGDIGVIAGTTHTFSIDLITISGTGAGGLKVEAWGGNALLGFQPDVLAPAASATWQTLQFDWAVPAGTDKMIFVPIWGANSKIGYDNVGVVPEPSTFALLGGLLALGFVMYRRRK
jgi:hypothetical protein